MSAAALLGLIDAASSLDAGIAAAFSEPGPRLLHPVDRFPEDMFVHIWNEIATMSTTPFIGLDIGQMSSPETQGLLSSWIGQSETLIEALKIFVSNIRLMNEGERWEIIRGTESTTVIISFARKADYPDAATDRSMSALVKKANMLAAEEFRFVRAGFSYAEPEVTEKHRALFGDNLYFSQEYNFLEIPNRQLLAQIQTSNPLMKSLITQEAQAALDQLDLGYGVSDKIRSVIAPLLPLRKVNADFVAGKLNMSRPSLYRALKEEQTSFSEIVDDTRKSLTLDLMKQGRANMAEIAAQTGFSETSSFRRAFRRWFGQSPADFQKTNNDR